MKVICLMAKSASGKSHLIKELKERYDVHEVKSYTTREVRKDDPNDHNTHVFVDNEFWENNKDKAIATYHSPNGYWNWTDINSFDKDRINLYCIDSICANDVFYPYCKENGIDCEFVYLDIDTEERKRRYLKREGNLDNFTNEPHLDKIHLGQELNTWVCSSSQMALIVLRNLCDDRGAAICK